MYYKDLVGLLPIKNEYADAFDDVVLNGKLVFYQFGFIFVDNKLNAFVLPYDLVKELNFYVEKEYWLEIVPEEAASIKPEAKNMIPANLICQNKFYLKVGKKFYDDKFKVLEKELTLNADSKKEDKISKAKRIEDRPCPCVHESQVVQNFFVQQKWNA